MDTSTLPKGLPSVEFNFDIEVVGSLTGHKYIGSFKFTIPNIARNSQIALFEARLNEGLQDSLDPSTALMHYMISYLKFTLDPDSLPAWWKEAKHGYSLYDPNVVTSIYQKCAEFEKEWQDKVNGTRTEGAKS